MYLSKYHLIQLLCCCRVILTYIIYIILFASVCRRMSALVCAIRSCPRGSAQTPPWTSACSQKNLRLCRLSELKERWLCVLRCLLSTLKFSCYNSNTDFFKSFPTQIYSMWRLPISVVNNPLKVRLVPWWPLKATLSRVWTEHCWVLTLLKSLIHSNILN